MRRLFPLVSLLSLVLSGTGCVDSDLGVVIAGNYSTPPTVTTCVPLQASNLSGQAPQPRGIFDVGVAIGSSAGYMMTPLVMNNLPARMVNNINLNNVELTGFDVQLAVDPGSTIAAAVPPNTPGVSSNTITVAGGSIMSQGGVAAASVQVIPVTVATKIFDPAHPLQKDGKTLLPLGPQASYPTINVRIRAHVRQDGNPEFSNFFDYPVDVCIFCLGQRIGSPGVPAIDPTTGTVDDCPADGADATKVVKNCQPQQDFPSSCCLSNSILLCGSSIPTMMKM